MSKLVCDKLSKFSKKIEKRLKVFRKEKIKSFFSFKIWHLFVGNRGKTVCMPVFSYKDVVNEESSLDGDVLCVTKMIKICSAMMDIVSKHQFEWMVFPTDLLPMEVSSPTYRS